MTADLVSICRDLLRKYHGAEFAGFVGPSTDVCYVQVKPGHHSTDGEWAREEEERQGRHRGPRRCTVFLERNQQVQK